MTSLYPIHYSERRTQGDLTVYPAGHFARDVILFFPSLYCNTTKFCTSYSMYVAWYVTKSDFVFVKDHEGGFWVWGLAAGLPSSTLWQGLHHGAWPGTHLFILEYGHGQVCIYLSCCLHGQVRTVFIYHGAWPGTHSYIMEPAQVRYRSFIIEPGSVAIAGCTSGRSGAHCPIVHHEARPAGTHSFTMEPSQKHIIIIKS